MAYDKCYNWIKKSPAGAEPSKHGNTTNLGKTCMRPLVDVVRSTSRVMSTTTSFNDVSSMDCSSRTETKEEFKESATSMKRQDIEVVSPAQRLSESTVMDDFPEGGLQGWLTVIGGSMVTFCTFGVVQSFGVYQDYYTRVSLTEQTPSEISWIGSIQVFLVFAIGLPAGRLLDLGYFHHCLLSGTVIYIFSTFMLSLAQPHHYYQNVLSQGLGMGIGMGLMFLPSLTITSHYFRKKRSLAMGVVVAGSSAGGCLYPVLLNNILQRSSGFAWAVRAVAFIDLGFLLIANLIMRTRLPPKRYQNSRGSGTFKEVLRDIPFLMFVLGTFLVFLGVFVPFFYLQLYGALHGVDPRFLKYAITVMNGASLFGRTVPNFLADYYGPLNVLIASSLISGALIFALFGATSIGGVAAFGICYGFFSGGVVSLAAPAVGSFVTHGDLSDLGIRIGMLSFGLAFALLIGNPVAGALLSPHHLWQRPLAFAAIVVFAGAVCHILVWKSLVKRKGSKLI